MVGWPALLRRRKISARYLFGLDRGQGTARFLGPAAPPVIGPNVLWDSIIRINPNGTGLFNNQLTGVVTPLSTADISVSGDEFSASVPLSLLLPAATRSPQEWTYNLWPRNGIGQNVQVSDLAPDDGNSPVQAIPEPTSLTLCGIFALGMLGYGWRRKKEKMNPKKKSLALRLLAPLCAVLLHAVVEVRPAYAAAGDTYNLSTLGGTNSAGHDINDAGQVVGSAQDALGRWRAFLWESSRGMTDLGTTNGYNEARAHAISNSGSVVGAEYDSVTGAPQAFAWTPNQPNGTTGTMTSLARDSYSTAADINAAGHVVGTSTYAYFVDDGSCTPDHPYYPNCGPGGTWYYEPSAVLWQNGVGSDLTNSSSPKAANAINNAGQVTGYNAEHAFRYEDTPGPGGVVHDLGTLGGSTSVGNAINNTGQVVGDSYIAGDTTQHAFRYTGTPGAGGVMVDLGTLGGTSSHAYDINDAGFVVGVADRAAGAGGGSWATLWLNDAGNTVVDLDAWLNAINPALSVYWRLNEARGINNYGLITGSGIYDDGPGGMSDGYRAFVLDASSLVSVPAIPGDFNHDGAVDSADYVIWRKTGGTSAGYNAWRANFGQPPGAGATGSAGAFPETIPEPASLSLLLVAVMALLTRKTRRNRSDFLAAAIRGSRIARRELRAAIRSNAKIMRSGDVPIDRSHDLPLAADSMTAAFPSPS